MFTTTTSRRLHRAIIVCVVACALVAPAASSAQDSRASAPTSSLAGTTSAPSQDLQPVPVRGNPAIDDNGISVAAGILLAIIALGLVGAATAQRRWSEPPTATAV
jgi:hypothetical protein